MNAKILVMMSTYNGEMYIRTQIDSLFAQKGVDVTLLVRDDGSSDGTMDILKSYKEKGCKIHYYEGENVGPALSFIDLLFNVADVKKYDYFAFCDQDDYWLDDKLYAAVEQLGLMDNEIPLLYYSRTQLVNEKLEPIMSCSSPHVESSSFEQALICSNAIGCTMCFNSKLMDMALQYRPKQITMHDAWIHKICLAMGGKVFYDSNPHICYRQHGGNVVGGTISFKKRWTRHVLSFLKGSQIRKKTIQELYRGFGENMPVENRQLCELYVNYDKSFFCKLKLLIKKTKIQDARVVLMYRLSVLLNVF